MVQTRFVRLAVWGFLVWWFGLVATLWSRESASQEALLTLEEFWEFLAQGLPKATTTSDRLPPPNHPLPMHGEVATNFAGWFVFEIQLMFLARIDGITPAALAAGPPQRGEA